MNDVLEYLIDGTSGLATGSVGGCIVAGICSKGIVGKGYLLGNRSDIDSILGAGELATKVKDIFAAGGQNPQVIAVPVEADEAGSVTNLTQGGAIEIVVAGAPKAAAVYRLEIIKSGALNVATYRLDGGEETALPADGKLEVDGVEVTFPDGSYAAGAIFSWKTTAPSASIEKVMTAIEKPLELYDTEFVYICGASDSAAWAAAQAKADELFNQHRPTYFKMEARLPKADESIDTWVAALKTERKTFAGRFVQVCAVYGSVTDSKGVTAVRNMAALQAGRTMAIPVQRAHGRVRDGGISGVVMPEGWNSAVQSVLEEAGFITAKNYAGLSGAYWGDSKTIADSTSDYQHEEVLRVTFKALRLARTAALKSMYDELGDPAMPADMKGAIFLQTNIENALSTMTRAIPKEMAAFKVVIPEGQDFVNNGVAMEMTFIGIPIIRQIKLYANYTYAGSAFDPRLK